MSKTGIKDNYVIYQKAWLKSAVKTEPLPAPADEGLPGQSTGSLNMFYQDSIIFKCGSDCKKRHACF